MDFKSTAQSKGDYSMSLNELTFAAIDNGISDTEKLMMLKEVYDLDDSHHHYNEFRGCRMIPIYNSTGLLGIHRPVKTRELKYTSAGDKCPTIKRVCEEKIFPWMSVLGRVTILRTERNHGLNVHVDCSSKEVNSLQHKYRVVLNGAIDKLYFIDENQDRVYVPKHYDSYVLDGGHPHSIDPCDEEKITLCVGAPWHGEDNEEYHRMCTESSFVMKVKKPKVKPEWVNPVLKRDTRD